MSSDEERQARLDQIKNLQQLQDTEWDNQWPKPGDEVWWRGHVYVCTAKANCGDTMYFQDFDIYAPWVDVDDPKTGDGWRVRLEVLSPTPHPPPLPLLPPLSSLPWGKWFLVGGTVFLIFLLISSRSCEQPGPQIAPPRNTSGYDPAKHAAEKDAALDRELKRAEDDLRKSN